MWKAIIAILILPLSAILNGWALSILWEWFIAKFFDLPLLTIAPAIGLSMVVTYLTHQRIDDSGSEKNSDEKFMEVIMYAVFKPLIAVLAGWIVTLFM